MLGHKAQKEQDKQMGNNRMMKTMTKKMTEGNKQSGGKKESCACHLFYRLFCHLFCRLVCLCPSLSQCILH